MEVFAVFGRVAMEGGEFVEAQMGRIGRQAETLGQRISRFGGGVAALGSRLFQGLTIPIAAGFAAAAATAMGFESSLARIQGLVGIAADEVENMGDQILRLAPKVGQGPAELADALFFVTSAGLRGQEAMDVLEASALAATSGMGEMRTIADLLTSAMNAYGTENLSAANAMDILAMAVRQGKAEPEELAGAMGTLLPFAAELGISFDQVSAATAAMTRTGTTAAIAGTQLRQIMATLIRPTNQAEEQLTAMGLSAQGLREQVREEGLLSVLQTLREVTNQYGEDALSKVFPNIRALAGVLDLMGENAEENEKIFLATADAMGTFDETVAAAEETMRFKLSQTMASVRALLTSVGLSVIEFVTPALDGLVSLLERVTTWWLNLEDSVKRNIIIFGLVLAALGPVIWIVGKLIMLFGGLLSPIGILKAVVAALAVGFVTNFLGIRDIVAGVVESVEDRLGSVSDAIQTLREALSGEWVDDEDIMPLHRLIGILGSLVRTLFALVTGDWNEFFRMTLRAPESLQPLLLGLHDLLAIFERVFIAIRDEGFIAGFEQMLEELPNLGELIGGAISGAVDVVAGIVSRINWSAVGDAAWSGIQSAISLAITAGEMVIDISATLLSWVIGAFEDIEWDDVSDVVADHINAAYASALDLAQEALDLAERFTKWLVEEISNIGWGDVGDEVESGFTRLFGFLGDFFIKLDIAHDIDEFIVQPTQEALSDLRDIIEPLIPIVAGLGAAFLTFKALSAVVSTFIAAKAALAGIAIAANPVTLIILAIAAVVGVLTAMFIANWGGIRDAVIGAAEPIIENVKEIISIFMEELGPTLKELKELWVLLAPAIKLIAINLGTLLVAAIGVLMIGLGGMVGFITGVLPGAFRVVRGAINIVIGAIELLETTITGIIEVVSLLLERDWAGAWKAARDTAKEMMDATIRILTGFKDVALGIVDVFVGGFLGFIEGLIDSAIGFFEGLWNSLTGKSIIPDMIDDILDLISELVDDFKDFISGLVDDVIQFFVDMAKDALTHVEEFADNVISSVEDMADEVVGFVTGIKDRVVEFFSDAKEWLKSSGEDVIKGFRDGLEDGVKKYNPPAVAARIGKGVADAITERGDSPWPETIQAGIDAIQGLVDGMSEKEQEAVQVASRVAQGVISAISSALDFSERLGTVDPSALGTFTDELESRLFNLTDRVMETMQRFAGRWDEEVLEGTSNAVQALRGIFGPFSDAIQFIERIQDVTLSDFDAWTKDLENELRHLTIDVLEVMWAFHETWSIQVMEGASAASDAMRGMFGPLSEAVSFLLAIQDITVSDFEVWTKDLEDGLHKLTMDVLEVMWTFAAFFHMEVMEAAGDAGNALRGIFGPFSEALAFIERAREITRADIEHWLDDLEDLLVDVALGLASRMIEASQQVEQEAVEAAAVFAEALMPIVQLVQPFMDAIDALRQQGRLTERMIDRWLENMALIVSGLEQLPDFALADIENEILVLFEGAGDWLFDSGVDIMDGLIRGVRSKVRELITLFEEISSKIPEWKGPAQVDRRLLQPAADDIMDGFIRRLSERQGDVAAVLEPLRGIVSSAVAPPGDGVVGRPVGQESRFQPIVNVYLGQEELEDLIVEAIDRRFGRTQ